MMDLMGMLLVDFNNHEIRFLRGLTHVLCAENPLNFSSRTS